MAGLEGTSSSYLCVWLEAHAQANVHIVCGDLKVPIETAQTVKSEMLLKIAKKAGQFVSCSHSLG